MPSTTNGSGTTGHKCLFQGGVSKQPPKPNAPRRLTSPLLTCPGLLHPNGSFLTMLVWVRREITKQNPLCGSSFLLFFSPSSLLPPSVYSSLSPLSSPLSLNLLHCSWTSPWIKTLSKNPLFKVISNFSARLSEICLFEGRIRCDRRFIVT